METSREHTWRAVRALEIYLERGYIALSYLEKGAYDIASEWLTKRNAAFYNFKAYDALAQQSGINLADYPEAKDIFEKLKDLEIKLVPLLELAHLQSLEQYRSLRATRLKLNQGYGTSSQEDSRITRSA